MSDDIITPVMRDSEDAEEKSMNVTIELAADVSHRLTPRSADRFENLLGTPPHGEEVDITVSGDRLADGCRVASPQHGPGVPAIRSESCSSSRVSRPASWSGLAHLHHCEIASTAAT